MSIQLAPLKKPKLVPPEYVIIENIDSILNKYIYMRRIMSTVANVREKCSNEYQKRGEWRERGRVKERERE